MPTVCSECTSSRGCVFNMKRHVIITRVFPNWRFYECELKKKIRQLNFAANDGMFKLCGCVCMFLAESYPKNSKRWSLPSCECVPIRSSWSCVLNKRATGARTHRAKTGRWALRHARSSSRCSSNWSEITARCSSPRRSVRIRAKFGTDFGVNIIHELKTYMYNVYIDIFGHKTVIFCVSLL